jgi:exodeoxyribonuclease III
MLRLLTYNIRHGGIGRADAIAHVIGECHADVVLLQEATDPATVGRIAAAAGMAEWRAFMRQSLAFMSRRPVASFESIRPRISRHAFIDVVPAGERVRIFGVHLSAVHAAWTERRRVLELRALLRSIARHQDGFHVLAGDFNTLAPGEVLDAKLLPLRLRSLLWLSGGRIRWRTIQTVLDAGYVDAFRRQHPADPGATLPTPMPHVRLDYVFVPHAYADRVVSCDVVRHPAAAAASDHFPVVADLDEAPAPVPGYRGAPTGAASRAMRAS